MIEPAPLSIIGNMPKTTTKTTENKPKVKPLMGYVLVDPEKGESTTAAGIYLPDSAQEKPAQGVVLSVGDPMYFDGKEIIPPVQVGQRVVYKKWGGDEIKISGHEYKLVKFEDLMAIIED